MMRVCWGQSVGLSEPVLGIRVQMNGEEMTEGRRCQVHLLDDRKLELLVQPKLLAKELLDLVASHFNLKEKEYFGIAFTDETRPIRIRPLKTVGDWSGGFSHSTVRQAGVATLFSPDLRPEVLGVAEAVPGGLLHLWVRMEGLVINLVNVNAPTLDPERLQFYQQASAFLGTLDSHECLVLGGDFNITLEERDHSGTEQSPAATNTLREIVKHPSLVDIWRDHHLDDTSTFTFVRVEAHWSCHSRLDRIYLSHFHLSRAHSSSIQLAPFSDYHLATATASLCAERLGPGYWHFNNSLLEDEGFVTSFREFWLAWRGQWRAFPSARRWWDLGKVHAWLFCRDYTLGTSRWRNVAIEQLEQEILELARRLATSPEDPLLCNACREKQEELRALEDHLARGVFVRSRIRLLQEMDCGSRFFYALEKMRGAKKHVTCLLGEDGTPLKKPDLNWTLTEPVSFGQGVRQGCPLSGQLYALAIEHFLCLLHRRLTGLVLWEPELRLVLSAYTDDVLLVVQDPGDLARVEACQAIYSAASSARVNWVKSSG
ncbi:unnamed protein product [Caretta caretta]